MRKENSQMPGALILRFTGLRDEISTCRCLVLSAAFLRCHPQDPESYSVRECFECCSMCREAKSSFSAWQRTIFTMSWTVNGPCLPREDASWRDGVRVTRRTDSVLSTVG